MVPISPTAYEVARRLLLDATPAGIEGLATTPSERLIATDRVCRALASTLSRSFGPYGYQALLARALSQAKGEHPVLAAISIRAPLDPCLEGLDEAAEAFGAERATEGVTAVFAGMIDLLGRLIGEDMAVRLVSEVKVLPHDVASEVRRARGDLP